MFTNIHVYITVRNMSYIFDKYLYLYKQSCSSELVGYFVRFQFSSHFIVPYFLQQINETDKNTSVRKNEPVY